MDEMRKNIAANLTKLRTEARLTQAELAERLAYSDKSVSKWERGESVPDIYVLSAIADMFDVTVDYLLHPHAPDEKPVTKGETKKKNRTIITTISLLGFLLLVTVAFTAVWAAIGKFVWMMYVIALPLCCIIVLIFNTLWFVKRNNLYIISALIWSLLTAIYLSLLVFAEKNVWLIFVIGIPAQTVACLPFFMDIRGRSKNQ